MLNISKDMGQGQGLRENMSYEATVVDNDDSKSDDGKRLCRVKARVAGIFEGISDEDLPWAIPDCHHVDGASSTSGSMDIPKIGTKVLLKFQNGSSEHPMYSGYIVDDLTELFEMKLNYPDRKVLLYQNSTLLCIDTRTKEIFIRNPGDFNIFIEGNANLKVMGNVVEKVMGNRTSYVEGDLTEIVGGNKVSIVKGNDTEILIGSKIQQTSGDQTIIALGSINEETGGSTVRTTRGNSEQYTGGNNVQAISGNSIVYTEKTDEHHSGTSMLRAAPYINDDLPQRGVPNTPPGLKQPERPEVPVLARWPGIRGNLPS